MVAVKKGTFYSGEKGTRKIGVDTVKEDRGRNTTER